MAKASSTANANPAPTSEMDPDKAAGIKGALTVKRSNEHRASFSRDPGTGQWVICVVGPNAHRFEGKTIPVKLYSGEESAETLKKLKWSGEFPSSGEHAATYFFIQKERKARLDDDIPF